MRFEEKTSCKGDISPLFIHRSHRLWASSLLWIHFVGERFEWINHEILTQSVSFGEGKWKRHNLAVKGWGTRSNGNDITLQMNIRSETVYYFVGLNPYKVPLRNIPNRSPHRCAVNETERLDLTCHAVGARLSTLDLMWRNVRDGNIFLYI